MSRRPLSNPELTLQDLLADPLIRLIMKADGISERELRELLDRAATDVRQTREIIREPMTPLQSDAPQAHRQGVGVMLVNSAGHVLVGQRCDIAGEAWQMPQGGIEPGETPHCAALRELREELGTANVEMIASSRDRLSYEFPSELLARIPLARWTGQTQQWFLMRFLGEDNDINIATEHPEFSAWRWVPSGDLLTLIVPFKRDLYRQVLAEFAPYLPQ